MTKLEKAFLVMFLAGLACAIATDGEHGLGFAIVGAGWFIFCRGEWK